MMAMPAVCFNNEDFYPKVLAIIKKLVPTAEQIIPASNQENAYQMVLQLAKKHTSRNKILILENPIIFDGTISDSRDKDIEIIPADNAALLCETIAISAERIAAIIVKHDKASNYYYKKVRELSSAEGAVMIWDNLHLPRIKADAPLNMSKKSFPDLICFNLNNVWIGGRSDLMSLISC